MAPANALQHHQFVANSAINAEYKPRRAIFQCQKINDCLSVARDARGVSGALIILCL